MLAQTPLAIIVLTQGATRIPDIPVVMVYQTAYAHHTDMRLLCTSILVLYVVFAGSPHYSPHHVRSALRMASESGCTRYSSARYHIHVLHGLVVVDLPGITHALLVS